MYQPPPSGAILARLYAIISHDPTLESTVLFADPPIPLPPALNEPSHDPTLLSTVPISFTHASQFTPSSSSASVSASAPLPSSHEAVLAAARQATAAGQSNPVRNPSSLPSMPIMIPPITRIPSESSVSSASPSESKSPTSGDEEIVGRERYADLILASESFQWIQPEHHKIQMRIWLLGLTDRRLLLVGLRFGIYGYYELLGSKGSRSRPVSTKERQCLTPNDSGDHSHSLRPLADITKRIMRQLEQETGLNSKKRRNLPNMSEGTSSRDSPTKRQRSGTPTNVVAIPVAAPAASSSYSSSSSPIPAIPVSNALSSQPLGKSVRSSHLDSIHDKFGKKPKSKSNKPKKPGQPNIANKIVQHHTGLYELYARFLLPSAFLSKHMHFKGTTVQPSNAVVYLRTCLEKQPGYKADEGEVLAALLEFWIERHEAQEEDARKATNVVPAAALSSSLASAGSSTPIPLVDICQLCKLLHDDGLPVPFEPLMNPADFVLQLMEVGQLADRLDLRGIEEWIQAHGGATQKDTSAAALRPDSSRDVAIPAQTVANPFVQFNEQGNAFAVDASAASQAQAIGASTTRLLSCPTSSNARMVPPTFGFQSHQGSNTMNQTMSDSSGSYIYESTNAWQPPPSSHSIATNVPTGALMSSSTFSPVLGPPQLHLRPEDAMMMESSLNGDPSNLELVPSFWSHVSPPPPTGSVFPSYHSTLLASSSPALSAELSQPTLSRTNTEESSVDSTSRYLRDDQ